MSFATRNELRDAGRGAVGKEALAGMKDGGTNKVQDMVGRRLGFADLMAGRDSR